MSVALDVRFDRPDFAGLADSVRSGLPDLLEKIGAEVESQTRRRFGENKASPAGDPWEDWSPRYAETRHAGQSLLQSEGDLADSIQSLVDGGDVLVGSPLVYAATHQFGSDESDGRNIPARPFLGLGPDDVREIEAVIADWLEERVTA